MASIQSSASSKIRKISSAVRRKTVFLGELPEDFLRISSIPKGEAFGGIDQVSRAAASDVSNIQREGPSEAQTQQALYSFIPPNIRGRLCILIVEAELAKNYGLVRMDPYCRIRVGIAVFETPTCASGGKSPKWNRIVNAYLPYGVDSMYLQIFDERAFSTDECIAWAHIVFPGGVFNGETIDDWYQLSGNQGDSMEGAIKLVISFNPVETIPLNAAIPPPQLQQEREVAISHEDAAEIQSMFPSVDIEVILCILEEKHGCKEAAVSVILEMSADP